MQNRNVDQTSLVSEGFTSIQHKEDHFASGIWQDTRAIARKKNYD